MNKPLVVILMGSKADLAHCERIAESARSFGLETVLRVGSAHKTAGHTLAILQQYEADPRPKVYITVAGRSNALSGFTDGAVSAPVIACPPPANPLAARIYILPCACLPALPQELSSNRLMLPCWRQKFWRCVIHKYARPFSVSSKNRRKRLFRMMVS